MDINASMLDQMLDGAMERYAAFLPHTQSPERQKSATFVVFCMAKYLGVSFDEAAEYFTDGSNDAGVDGLYLEDTDGNEIHVTLFQEKYSRSFDAKNEFPTNAVEKTIATIKNIFDPNKDISVNDALKAKLEEIRSFIRDGQLPVVRVVFCNNGLPWNSQAQNKIDQASFPKDQVFWEFFNHNNIINILKTPKKININIQFHGKSIEETFSYKRVLIGKVNVEEIARLIGEYDNLLLEGNIRRFLGIEGNRVNMAIYDTLTSVDNRNDFYFLNNGITFICNKFILNGLQSENHKVKLEDARIVNGGQTSKIIANVLLNPLYAKQDFSSCFVMVRVYETSEDDIDIIRDITRATNSQNPVDLTDLHSNDECQKILAVGLNQLGFVYRHHRSNDKIENNCILSKVLAESVLAVLRKCPHQAKFMRKEHFGKLYQTIFNGLNPAEAAVSFLVLRRVEQLQKNPLPHPPAFLPYASHYIAMIIGLQIEKEIGSINMKNYDQCKMLLDQKFTFFYNSTLDIIQKSLESLYVKKSLSLQQLAATFRRGDLIQLIENDFKIKS